LSSFHSYYVATIGLSPRAYVRSITLPAVLSAATGAAVFGLYGALGRAGIQPFFELTLLVGSGIAIYTLLNIFIMRKELTGLWHEIHGKDSAPHDIIGQGNQ
jgi:hypothetical protein